MITVETILKASEEQIKKYLELNKNSAKRFVEKNLSLHCRLLPESLLGSGAAVKVQLFR